MPTRQGCEGRFLQLYILQKLLDLLFAQSGGFGYVVKGNAQCKEVLGGLEKGFFTAFFHSIHHSLYHTILYSALIAGLLSELALALHHFLHIFELQYIPYIVPFIHICKFCNLTFLIKPLEHRGHRFHIVLVQMYGLRQHIEPMVALVGHIQRLQLGGKFTQFHEIEDVLFGKNFVSVILQIYPPEEVPIPFEFRHIVSHYVQGINAFDILIQIITPLHTLSGSPPHIDNCTVAEMLLPSVLHLHDETVAVLVLAVQVETDKLVLLAAPEQLGGQIGDIGDGARIFGYEGVEQVDEDVLVPFGGQQPLESEVGERVDDLQPVLPDVGLGFLYARQTFRDSVRCSICARRIGSPPLLPLSFLFHFAVVGLVLESQRYDN